MTTSYSGNPSASPLDEVRFLTKDTGTSGEWFLTDEEIAYLLAQDTNPKIAASYAANQISIIFGTRASKSIGPLTIRYRDQKQAYSELAAQLREMANATSAADAGPFTTQSSMDHIFTIGMHDMPGASLQGPQGTPVPWSGSGA